MKKGGNDFEIKRRLFIASNNLGDPESKYSPGQASFRKDLHIIAEAAGIGKENASRFFRRPPWTLLVNHK